MVLYSLSDAVGAQDLTKKIIGVVTPAHDNLYLICALLVIVIDRFDYIISTNFAHKLRSGVSIPIILSAIIAIGLLINPTISPENMSGYNNAISIFFFIVSLFLLIFGLSEGGFITTSDDQPDANMLEPDRAKATLNRWLGYKVAIFLCLSLLIIPTLLAIFMPSWAGTQYKQYPLSYLSVFAFAALIPIIITVYCNQKNNQTCTQKSQAWMGFLLNVFSIYGMLLSIQYIWPPLIPWGNNGGYTQQY